MFRQLGLAIALLGLAVGNGNAATLLVDGSGELTGALGVVIGSNTYDLAFVDTTCPAEFTGCDSPSDFAFTSLADALTASQALLDQVFLDGLSGNFDSSPELTAGCTLVSNCAAYTPYAFDGTNVSVALANNFLGAVPDEVSGSNFNAGNDFASSPSQVWARWTPAASAVPEPGTLSLLGAGLVGLALARRKRRHGRRRTV